MRNCGKDLFGFQGSEAHTLRRGKGRGARRGGRISLATRRGCFIPRRKFEPQPALLYTDLLTRYLSWPPRLLFLKVESLEARLCQGRILYCVQAL